ncbi:two-component system response regulator [Geotalea uraniireducens]|uniref:Two-component system response regulator n=1 Tax=Geotalea uraniireducens TaxID=351604 RepID=A0ABM8EIN0_9BACT|nr:response regulator [Geotalea uraniireducens]BDV42255.1 two-component system response regulator [Geotalea uraniireducens]
MPKPKILLVDDVNLMLELEKSYLRFSPVRLFTARDGAEALEVVRAERPDLVFMDLNMPKMSGAECCAAIKADPELAATPVVMVTTAGNPEDEALCRRSGCDGYITKPIDRRLFLEAGRRYLPDIDRREPRYVFSTRISCQSGEEELTGTTADISIGGLYMAVNGQLGQDERIEMVFSLPGCQQKIKVQGRVAWLNNDEARRKPRLPAGFGVEFMAIDPDDLDKVKRYVESLRPAVPPLRRLG